MYFCINEFEVHINDSVVSGNEQQRVYYEKPLCVTCHLSMTLNKICCDNMLGKNTSLLINVCGYQSKQSGYLFTQKATWTSVHLQSSQVTWYLAKAGHC